MAVLKFARVWPKYLRQQNAGLVNILFHSLTITMLKVGVLERKKERERVVSEVLMLDTWTTGTHTGDPGVP